MKRHASTGGEHCSEKDRVTAAPTSTLHERDWPTEYSQAAEHEWDAVVIGGGPAGGMTALRLAERGYRVLLVEAKRFPRNKVCGGCLNQRAWNVLQSAGLAEVIEQSGAIELSRLQLTCGGQTVDWAMPTMRAISRARLDDLIVQAAVHRGACFVMETQARVLTNHTSNASQTYPSREMLSCSSSQQFIAVELKSRSGTSVAVRAKVVIAADGLTHPSLVDFEQVASRVAAGSSIGLGAQFLCEGNAYPHGRLTMVVGRWGYIGITRLEGGRLNVAAALSPTRLQQGASPGEVIACMLRDANHQPPPGCEEATWLGTPPLTRESPRCAAHRLFLVGDATGYVEPFTGEGMSWALVGALEVSRIAEQAILSWSNDLVRQWDLAWRTRVKQNQVTCRALAWLLRRPRLAAATLRGVQYVPWVARAVMRRVAGTADACPPPFPATQLANHTDRSHQSVA